MTFSAHVDNEKKDILVLGLAPTQGLERMYSMQKERMYSINFTEKNKKFCLS